MASYSEVTLNVCLGKQITGGQLVYFRGVQFDNHVNLETLLEVFDQWSVVVSCILHIDKPLLDTEDQNQVCLCKPRKNCRDPFQVHFC
ncbi:hypothetical protein RchiOBHm_Chr6g0274531 [Rosa chinensis]|uniref:Uncharacterized protein n=1 Tax=Rosa chinensis TaxID=74649 RepID=A0A2P6PRS2_ROSCH|nr:hypothetical protein RchiOBHm_Chr6g0274531 [Rosa chinensis]